MPAQYFLPGFVIADLFATRKTITIATNAAGVVGIFKATPSAVAVIAICADGTVKPFPESAIDVQITEFRIILKEGRAIGPLLLIIDEAGGS